MPKLLELPAVLLVVLTAAAGCSTHTRYAIGEPRTGRGTRAAEIQVIDSPDQLEYLAVGRVHAHGRAVSWLPWFLPSQDELLEKLKVEAASLHADAILDIKRYSRTQFEWREEHIMGTAAIILSKEAGDER